VSDPVTAIPDELRTAPPAASNALQLLRRRDFRNVYFAVGASELGDALHYIALMWFAFDAGGPLGVVAVRLADSVPALVFGLHGGLAADRWDRRRSVYAGRAARASSRHGCAKALRRSGRAPHSRRVSPSSESV
jgi:Transmembrane secretion effector